MKLHRKLARLFDYELIKRKKHPTSHTHTINLINRYNINLVLDVGANTGQFGAMLREEGYRGEIHSFEPVTKTFQQLSARAAGDSLWHVHQMALGDAPGELVINVTESSDLSSFLDPNDFGGKKYEHIAVSSRETVAVGTVDDFVAALGQGGDGKNILLKMDTQGYDLNVMRGAEKSLPRIVAVLSELSLIPIYTQMPDYLEALRVYTNLGFAVTGLYPISRNDDFTVIEMDCMLVNESKIKPR